MNGLDTVVDREGRGLVTNDVSGGEGGTGPGCTGCGGGSPFSKPLIILNIFIQRAWVSPGIIGGRTSYSHHQVADKDSWTPFQSAAIKQQHKTNPSVVFYPKNFSKTVNSNCHFT